MPGCTRCPDAYSCEECIPSMLLNFQGVGCQDPIRHCESSSINYFHDQYEYVCPDCMMGYYPFRNECRECPTDELDNCIDCADAETCTACAEPYVLDESNTKCMRAIRNCTVYREDYQTFFLNDTELSAHDIEHGDFHDIYGYLWCPQCDTGLSWNFDIDVWKCDVCANLIPNCVDCADELFENGEGESYLVRRCIECDNGWYPSYDGSYCFLPFENCLDELNTEVIQGLYGDIYDNEYICSECELGFFWNFENRACEECSFFGPHCLRCSDQFGCELCDGG